LRRPTETQGTKELLILANRNKFPGMVMDLKMSNRKGIQPPNQIEKKTIIKPDRTPIKDCDPLIKKNSINCPPIKPKINPRME